MHLPCGGNGKFLFRDMVGRQPAVLIQADQLGGQEVVEQVEHPAPDDAVPNFPPKIDITRSVLLDLQNGQVTARFSCSE